MIWQCVCISIWTSLEYIDQHPFFKLCNIQRMNKSQFINPSKNGRTNKTQKELEDVRINGRVFKNWSHPVWAYENFLDCRKAVLVNTSTNLEMIHLSVTGTVAAALRTISIFACVSLHLDSLLYFLNNLASLNKYILKFCEPL